MIPSAVACAVNITQTDHFDNVKWLPDKHLVVDEWTSVRLVLLLLAWAIPPTVPAVRSLTVLDISWRAARLGAGEED
jgi:hypothetical protein